MTYIETQYNSKPFYVYSGNWHCVSNAIRRSQDAGGTWDCDAQDDVIAAADKDKYFIDVGGEIGTWTVTMAEHFKGVVVFEPNAKYQSILEQNIQFRELANVQLIRKAVADGVFKGEMTAASETVLVESAEGSVTVTSLDEELKILGIDYDQVGAIKIDVEGFEYRVLQGAVNTIEQSLPHVYLETHPGMPDNPTCVEDSENWLAKKNYQVTKAYTDIDKLWTSQK